MRRSFFPLLALFAVVEALPQVKLGKATVVGQGVSEKVEFFGGIPFAEPPVGELRFKAPVLKTHLPGTTFNATSYGNACIQPPLFGPATSLSEDCLFVNVYRPTGIAPTAKLPILFWIYGGGFFIGSSNQYDGKDLVARSVERGTPIIYVNINYRLGPLGFPQGQEAHDKGALNLGILDQTAALEWVQANIHAFGGDKNKVTIFGESAGAMSIGVLYLNPRLESLARAAIFESGSSNGPTTYPAARNEDVWKGFVEKVPSCASVASSGKTFDCLKKASAEEIAAGVLASAQLGLSLSWAPTLDTGRGSVYPDYASRLYAKGHFARLPFIAGTNRDEGTAFASQAPLSDQDIKDMLVLQHLPAVTAPLELNNTADRLLKLYPDDPTVGSPYGTGAELFGLPSSYKRYASLMGDLTFVAPRRQWSQVAAKAGVKSYAYHFTHPQPVPQIGVNHGSEIAYVYAQPPVTDSAGQGISAIIADYWISFTVSLNPNDGKGVKRPEWPQYTTKNQVAMQLEGGNTTAVKDDFRKEQIAYLIKKSLVLRR
ncbi:triacylglycerol lipase 3 [Ephemerocybe angulata]|uniref:Carboxylic ester hydrolase n=1 Tax=Ephemerocybe angulata TaxID=980116 RepID=A0A8H6LZ67_9AGAR|nr:triacylglycerol lipase 3 [Tulosesus angulatus]